MKNLVIALLGVFVCVNSAFSQNRLSENVELEFSTPYPIVKGFNREYFSYKENIIGIKMSNSLQVYDGSIPKETKRMEGDYSMSYEIKVQNKEVVKFLNYKKEGNVFLFYTHELNVITGKYQANTGDLYKIENPGYFNGEYINIESNSDSSMFVIYYTHSPKEKDNSINKQVVEFLIIDKEFNLVNRSTAQMPYVESQIGILGITLTMKGEIFNLILKKDAENPRVELLKLDGDSFEVFEVPMLSDKVVPKKAVFSELNDETLVLEGIYADADNVKNGYDGVFRIDISKSGEVKNYFLYEFPTSILVKYQYERKIASLLAKEKNGENNYATDLYISEIRKLKEGSVYVIEDINEKDDYTIIGNYYLIYVNNVGDLKWMHVIPRNHSSEDESKIFFDESTVKVFSRNEEVDREITEDKMATRIIRTKQGGDLTLYNIDISNGELSKRIILNFSTSYTSAQNEIDLDRLVRLSKNTFVIENYIGKNNDVMTKITINELK